MGVLVERVAGPVFGFMEQHHLVRLHACVGLHGPVSVSYSFRLHPCQPEHPDNYVALTPDQDAAITAAQRQLLPPPLGDLVAALRYPALWDAVRTGHSRPVDAVRAQLVTHLCDATERMGGDASTVPADIGAARPQRAVVDGRAVMGVVVESAGLVGLGLEIGECVVTAVLERAYLSFVRWEFVQLSPGAV